MTKFGNLLLWCCLMYIFAGTGLQANPPRHAAYKSERSNSIERLLIEVNNVPEGNKALPASNGIVKIKRGLFSRRVETRDRIAEFHDIKVGKAYTFSVFNKSNSAPFNHALEFWGKWQNIVIDPANPKFTLTRQMPFIFNITTRHSAIDRLNPSFEVGDTITISLTIKNPSSLKLKSTAVIMLRNLTNSKIHKVEKEITLNPYENNKHVFLYFVATEPGGYLFAPGIFVQEPINQWTDCWDWSEKPFFYVAQEHRYLYFAGYQWYIKTGFGNPGGNHWSDDSTHVWIDDDGGLHLTLAKKGDNWYSSEVISKETFSYGTYTFNITARPAYFDPHVVGGIFLYYDETNEIDIEFSRWGDADNHKFGNYVVQPAEYPGNHFRFPLLTYDTITTHQIIWRPDALSFISWRGHQANPHQDNIISSWQYTGNHNPKAGKLKLFFNLWLFRGTFPQGNRKETFTINNFTYEPMQEN